MGGYRDPEKQKSIVKSNFLKYIKEIDRVPTYSELRRTPDGYQYLSASSIERNFGSYSNLLNECDLVGSQRPNQFNSYQEFSDDEILDAIEEVCGQSKLYNIKYYHHNKLPGMPGLKAIKLHFGSWRKALSQIHNNVNEHVLSRKFVTSKDGHICDSVEESIVDDWLFDNNIRHIVHQQYPDSKLVMDFYLPDYGIIIEYAGLYNMSGLNNRRQTYRDKLTQKEEIAEEHGLQWIMVVPADLPRLSDIIVI